MSDGDHHVCRDIALVNLSKSANTAGARLAIFEWC
jgi:hypothetical protein